MMIIIHLDNCVGVALWVGDALQCASNYGDYMSFAPTMQPSILFLFYLFIFVRQKSDMPNTKAHEALTTWQVYVK